MDLHSGAESVVFADALPAKTQFYLVGWFDNDRSLVGLRFTAHSDLTQRIEILSIERSGQLRVLGTVARGFASTAWLDAERETLYLTLIEGGAHNIHAFPLAGGKARRLTDNQLPGVTFSGISSLGDGTLVYARQVENYDIWMLQSEP